MGEEEKKEEEKKVDEKEEKKKEEEVPQEVVLRVDMHCGACARKVARSLKGFQGVEEVTTDCKASKVVVKGKELDPIKVSERIQKKSGRKVEIISPLPKPPEAEPEKKQEPEPPKDEKKDEPPPVITVVLKMSMHCDACAQGLQKRIRKIPGVESVKTELAKEQVVVTGVIEPEKFVNDVYKRTRKQASIVGKAEEKKEEEKKEEEKKEEEKKEEETEEVKNEEADTNTETKRSEYWPPKYYMEYSHAPQMFSDENPHACSVM
ncbi:heavy metal-associated isoprenylated plant protein 7 [Lactuca sativa]|uniref:heavy metal-associated isoprenylated plant protein 7 n=1 Tax=Lactuca sativa TaxID=4236 RepID=UPI000CD9847D|nr:heavy metal-associated isoprenylated plant protein 7 [Lactuca sativa]